jgi:hypothetical protein
MLETARICSNRSCAIKAMAELHTFLVVPSVFLSKGFDCHFSTFYIDSTVYAGIATSQRNCVDVYVNYLAFLLLEHCVYSSNTLISQTMQRH